MALVASTSASIHGQLPESPGREESRDKQETRDTTQLLDLLDLILQLSKLVFHHYNAGDPEMGKSQLCQPDEKGSSQNQKPPLARTSGRARAKGEEKMKLAEHEFLCLEHQLNRLLLWKADVVEAELEETLVKGSPMFEPIKRLLAQIANIVIAVWPKDYLQTRAIDDIVKEIQMTIGKTSDIGRKSSSKSSSAVGKIMMVTKDHDIKEVQGPEILMAMRRSVDNLMGLWNFMELAQQTPSQLSRIVPESPSVKRKRRSSLDFAESDTKKRLLEKSDKDI